MAAALTAALTVNPPPTVYNAYTGRQTIGLIVGTKGIDSGRLICGCAPRGRSS